jgi:transportin-3
MAILPPHLSPPLPLHVVFFHIGPGLTHIDTLEAHPDLVDDSFLLASRALSYCPRMIVLPHLLPQLLDSALLGVMVQHREANSSVLGFMHRWVGATGRGTSP